MKDSGGHGSEAGHGHGFVTQGGRGIMPSRPFRHGTGHQVSLAEQHGFGTDHLVGQHVRDAYRNAAEHGPEHASVGASLRAAAGLERDSAASASQGHGLRYAAARERDHAASESKRFGKRADAALARYRAGR